MSYRSFLILLVIVILCCCAVYFLKNIKEKPNYDFIFRDVSDEVGLYPHLAGIQGHAAGWGDAHGTGWLDLYVGTFSETTGKGNLFFRNNKGKFILEKQESLQLKGRFSSALFADFENSDHLDLYVSSMPQSEKNLVGSRLFRNDGKGNFTDVSENSGVTPKAFGARSAALLDYNGDGLLDLLVGEDPFPGYNGSKTKSTRLFRNKGNLKFEEVTQAVGIPAGIPGLGVASADLNNDGWPDLFIASSEGGNVLFLNDGKGKFIEVPGSRKLFSWKNSGKAGGNSDNMITGVAFGDVNHDGLLDIVIGQHYSTPWVNPVPIRLYLNRGMKNGQLVFEDVTEAAGLTALPMKAPHVEIQDFDNDGWPDIFVSTVKFVNGKPHPIIFKNLGIDKNGIPHFRADALNVNDFPTIEDQSIKDSDKFFKKMLQDKKIIYMAAGPSGDFDNDGRLDIFLPNWWPESRSLLLHNETPGGHWLDVRVQGNKRLGINQMGIGVKIKVFPAGKLGDMTALLGYQEISAGYGYASGQAAIAHFGLGNEKQVDLEILLPFGKGKIELRNINANQRLVVPLFNR